MLDQNTDRMWYVIGAVIIGAAIILIMNKTFPQLFASIGETFQDKTDQTTEITDGIMPGQKHTSLLNPDTLLMHNAKNLGYDATTDTWTIEIAKPTAQEPWSNVFSAGMIAKEKSVIVPYGARYSVRYEVLLPEGLTDVVAYNDLNNFPVDENVVAWNGNDNDYGSKRTQLNDRTPIVPGKWTPIAFSYVNDHPKNTTKAALYDGTYFGLLNQTGKPITVQIRNVTGTLSEQ